METKDHHLPAALGKFSEVADFRETLSPESDRGCALIAASYLDSQIEALLRKSLVNDSKIVDELLGRSKPLATFSSRIDLAYALGMIGKNDHRDLHLIRKIRNDFSHEWSPISFSNETIAKRCAELKSTSSDTDPRQRFIRRVMHLLANIHVCTSLAKPRKPAGDGLSESESNRRTDELEKRVKELVKEEAKAFLNGTISQSELKKRLRESVLKMCLDRNV